METGLQSPEVADGKVPVRFRLGHRPALDGLRGVSILGVIALHANLCSNRSAFVGVDIFFVLSGFLITCLLLQEWDRGHTLSLKRFYLRRALRLLPALTAMLATFVVYQWWVGPRASAVTVSGDALQAVFYCRNWVLALGPVYRTGFFAHTWSLSIEEQFYLLWPPLLVLLLRRTGSRRSLFCWVLLGVFVAAFTRFVLVAVGAGYARLAFGTDTRCDALLLGCAGAAALSSGLVPEGAWVPRLRRGLALASVLGLVWLTFWRPFSFEADVSIAYFLIPLFALFVLLEAVSAESGLLSRVLSQRWLVYLGQISYGLYLWHLPIFLHVQGKQWSRPKELTVEFALTAAVVLGSYYLLEKPFLRLKGRFAVEPGTGTC